MHGCKANSALATDSLSPREPTRKQGVQSADTNHAVVAGRTQHVARMEASAGNSTSREGSLRCTADDMEGLRPSGSGHRRTQAEANTDERVACVVVSTGHADDTVRAEEQAQPRGTPVTTSTVLGLLERQGYRCALTGRQLTPETAALDHIIPIKYGGEHVIENTQVLHKDVNRAKNSMTNVEFAQMCEEVAEAWRRRVSSAPTSAHVADWDGSAGMGATSNHDATRGDDAAASGRG